MIDISFVKTAEKTIQEPWASELQTIVASIIIVNYNGQDFLEDCLHSIFETIGSNVEVILVDNDSHDGSPDEIARLFPEIRLIRSTENQGFAAGSNLGSQYARGQYLVFLNPDTQTANGWLEALLTALKESPKAGLVTSKILLLDRVDKINTAGNDVHLTGLTLCRGMGLTRNSFDDTGEVGAVSGAAFAIRRDLFNLLNGFDPHFFMYMEDTDLSLRAQLAGYRCLYTPASVVYHDYNLHFGPHKIYYQERNRYRMLLKILRWPTIFLLLPALLLAEIVSWGYVLLEDSNHFTNKLRAYGYVLSHWREIMAERRKAQDLRRIPDRDLLEHSVSRLDYAQTGATGASRMARLVFDPLFGFWHAVTLALIKW